MTDDDSDDNTPREHLVTNSERLAHFEGFEQRIERLEKRAEEQHLEVASLLASRRSWRWTLGVGLPVLLSSVVLVMLWSIDRVSVSSERAGRTEGKFEAHDKLFELLEKSIDQLRQRAGLDSKPTSDVWSLPDKLSLHPNKDPHALVSLP